MTKTQAQRQAKRMIEKFPNSPCGIIFYMGTWGVSFGMSFLATPEKVQEEIQLREAEESELVAMLNQLDGVSA